MIKLRIVSLSILLLFSSSGCVPYFQKSPVSQKNETIVPPKIKPESNSVAVTDDPPAPAQKPSDTPPPAPKPEETIDDEPAADVQLSGDTDVKIEKPIKD